MVDRPAAAAAVRLAWRGKLLCPRQMQAIADPCAALPGPTLSLALNGRLVVDTARP
jgi:hypothetical protein